MPALQACMVTPTSGPRIFWKVVQHHPGLDTFVLDGPYTQCSGEFRQILGKGKAGDDVGPLPQKL